MNMIKTNKNINKKYVKDLLSTYIDLGDVSITSSYGYDYKENYDKNDIITIENNFTNESIGQMSLYQAKNLNNLLNDLINYYENFDYNPTILNIQNKREILLNHIKKDKTNIITSMVIDSMTEDKLDKLLIFLEEM